MDPFTPIQVDPDPENRPTGENRPQPEPPGIPAGKPDVADVALAAVQNLAILGVIEHQFDETASGAAEVTGASGYVGPSGELMATRGDPLDDRDPPHVDPAAGGDGCLAAAFALLLTLTLAAGSALAILP